MFCIALHCIVLHCFALHCFALHCIVLHCFALHCIALFCIVLHCFTLHCLALHCIVLYSIALQCFALHCIALHCFAADDSGAGGRVYRDNEGTAHCPQHPATHFLICSKQTSAFSLQKTQSTVVKSAHCVACHCLVTLCDTQYILCLLYNASRVNIQCRAYLV